VCRSVADYAKDVSVVEYAASGHAPFIDEGELYHAELHRFIAKQF
jgi:pimeloyl-ACP methyl ester carboxylesterase